MTNRQDLIKLMAIAAKHTPKIVSEMIVFCDAVKSGDSEARNILDLAENRSHEENLDAYISFLKGHKADVEAVLAAF